MRWVSTGCSVAGASVKTYIEIPETREHKLLADEVRGLTVRAKQMQELIKRVRKEMTGPPGPRGPQGARGQQILSIIHSTDWKI